MDIRASLGMVATVTALVIVTGCDNITGLDNRPPPNSTLTGRIVYQGQPLEVASGRVELELWQPGYELNQKIRLYVAQEGSFETKLFDGDYKLSLIQNKDPWVNNLDTINIQLRGSATVDVPVTPYYVIANPTYTRGAPSAATPGGTVSVTFRVGKINTERAVDFVGLYVGTSRFVDPINSLPIANAQRQRTRAQIQSALDSDGDITITVALPANIYETNSPWRREFVFVRVGVKTAGRSELLFSPVVELAI